MKPLMKYVDICICNEEDAEKVLGIKSAGSDIEIGKLNDAGYIQTAEMIHSQYGCRYIATTLRNSFSAGRNGWRAILYDAEIEKIFFSRLYDIQIVDRVGGGDSFVAGLIYTLGSGMDYQDVIEFATAANCLKHTIEGDFNRIIVDDVNMLLESGGNGRIDR